jgi:hypothetical protein
MLKIFGLLACFGNLQELEAGLVLELRTLTSVVIRQGLNSKVPMACTLLVLR